MQASGAEANRAFTVISEATEWGSSSTARIGCFHLLSLNIRCAQLMGVYDKLGLKIYW
ncbi:hypothetical protein AHAS_Ahas06G0071300 [Arachis hypogaea]